MGRDAVYLALGVATSLALAPPAGAEDWRPLDGRAIEAALSGATLVYPTGRQTFQAIGRTLYEADEESWGFWRVDDDLFCSQWPPSNRWRCYTVSRDAETGSIRFDDGRGDVSIGRPE